MTTIKLRQPPPFLFSHSISVSPFFRCRGYRHPARQLGRQQPTGRNKDRFQRRSQKHSHKKTDSSDTFTGNLSTLVKNENEIAVFYPAAAITANSSDTLTQTLNLSGQDGTLAGITNYDYLWAQCKAGMNETTGSSACEMTSLVTIGKFQFTVNGGSPLNNITRITITATAGTLYSSAVMKLKTESSAVPKQEISLLKQSRYFRNHLHLLLPFRSTVAFHSCYHHR